MAKIYYFGDRVAMLDLNIAEPSSITTRMGTRLSITANG